MDSEQQNAAQKRQSVDFWKFWTGQAISSLGDSFSGFALPLLVYSLTGSALNLAISTAAYMLPYLLFGLFIGAWADRLDRKRLMILVDLGRALVLATAWSNTSGEMMAGTCRIICCSGFVRSWATTSPFRRIVFDFA